MPTEPAGADAPIAWGLTANVAPQHHVGDGGRVRSGTRYFTVGTKVWICPPQWGDGGEQVIVLGRRRGTHGRKWSRVVMYIDRFTAFRAAPIYSPSVYRRLTRPWTHPLYRDGSCGHNDRAAWESPIRYTWTREIAESWAQSLNQRIPRWWEGEPEPRSATVRRMGWAGVRP
ncbi:hypothetical protein HNR23_004075 [Nocardiopsis mwathae]|uniref:Uncharacterized protein n=1 Tax=Nocardiopsis mwathae TaxID=1472723 RepID=A0A7W9YL61_9ACTN|nr:hypothetical protein [Nocardiopsis mwathae]MBB6174015.1 hypothetical protein [Nocardiopsis mwathae]